MRLFLEALRVTVYFYNRHQCNQQIINNFLNDKEIYIFQSQI